MAKHAQLALKDPAEWLGNWHPLAEQLGARFVVALIVTTVAGPALVIG